MSQVKSSQGADNGWSAGTSGGNARNMGDPEEWDDSGGGGGGGWMDEDPSPFTQEAEPVRPSSPRTVGAPSLTGPIPQAGPGEDESTGAAGFDMATTAMDDDGTPEGQAAALALEALGAGGGGDLLGPFTQEEESPRPQHGQRPYHGRSEQEVEAAGAPRATGTGNGFEAWDGSGGGGGHGGEVGEEQHPFTQEPLEQEAVTDTAADDAAAAVLRGGVALGPAGAPQQRRPASTAKARAAMAVAEEEHQMRMAGTPMTTRLAAGATMTTTTTTTAMVTKEGTAALPRQRTLGSERRGGRTEAGQQKKAGQQRQAVALYDLQIAAWEEETAIASTQRAGAP